MIDEMNDDELLHYCIAKIYAARPALAGMTPGPDIYKGVEVIVSVDMHVRLVSIAEEMLHWNGMTPAPSGFRMFGMPVLRDPTLEPIEMRLRKEVVL